MARVPVFRRFRHDELKKIGVKDGNADSAFLLTAVENTNRLIREKRHIPPVKQTHSGSIDGTARGWTSGVETDGTTLFADLGLTPKGKQQVEDKELRFVSASFRANFALTGEPDGERLPGPYLDHVALLGDENPAVKALVDLAEIQFSETEKDAPRAWLVSDPNVFGEVTYFAEVPPSCAGSDTQEDDNGTTKEPQMAEDVAALKEKHDKLSADFAEAQKAREASDAKVKDLEAQLKQRDEADRAAKFAEHKATVKARLDKAQAAKKLTAERYIELTTKGEKAYGNPDAMALFSELLDALDPVVPPPLPKDEKAETDTPASDVKAADFSETGMSDPASIKRVHEAALAHMAAHPAKEGTPYNVAYMQAMQAVKAAATK